MLAATETFTPEWLMDFDPEAFVSLAVGWGGGLRH